MVSPSSGVWPSLPCPTSKDYAELQQHVDARCLEYIETHKIRYRLAASRPCLRMSANPFLPCRSFPWRPPKRLPPWSIPDLTVLLDGTRYSVPSDYVGERVTLKVSPFTVAVWARGELVYRHKRALRKGDHQYDPRHYLELLTSKPRSIANAAPLRKGVMPKELKGLPRLCARTRTRSSNCSIVCCFPGS